MQNIKQESCVPMYQCTEVVHPMYLNAHVPNWVVLPLVQAYRY